MQPATRRNLIIGLLALTALAAILAPDAPQPITGNSASIRTTHSALRPAPSPMPESGAMLPEKRPALAYEPKDIFQLEKPAMTAAELSKVQRQPAPPPMAPPLPFVYMGKILDRGQRSVFLTRDERAYVAKAGDVLDGVYRVDAIKPPVLELTYLPLSQKQILNIGEEK